MSVRKDKNKKSAGINIGTSSILVTFVLLCLVTFAALTYLSADSDYRLSVEAANRTNYYYDANRMAEIYLADVESRLAKHGAQAAGADDYYEGIEKLFSDNGKITVYSKEDEKVYISYEVPVTNTQNLKVSLRAVYPPQADGKLYYIEEWATATNPEFVENTKNAVIDNLMEME